MPSAKAVATMGLSTFRLAGVLTGSLAENGVNQRRSSIGVAIGNGPPVLRQNSRQICPPTESRLFLPSHVASTEQAALVSTDAPPVLSSGNGKAQ